MKLAKFKSLILSLIFTSLIISNINTLYLAIIKDPIIEMNTSFPPPTNPACSPDTNGCRRAHQGLYNECVQCLEENGEFVKTAYNNIIYGFDAQTKEPLNILKMSQKMQLPMFGAEAVL